MNKKPVVLIIMDGYGLRTELKGNGINQAHKKFLHNFFKTHPFTTLEASGEAVGLPEGQMGNSEVGHMNMGAGRVVYQSLTLINKCIKDGSFFKNEYYLRAIDNVRNTNKTLHIMGLCSDGGVHSHIDHIIAMLRMCKENELTKEQVALHLFMDGRDVSPTSGKSFVEKIQNAIDEIGVGVICSIHGRYYAMDRDKNMDRIDLSYKVLTERKGNSFSDPLKYFDEQYDFLEKSGKERSDEFIVPGYNENYNITIKDGDSVIFMNFRPDRAIQISTLITNPHFYENPPIKNQETKELAYKSYTPNVVLHDITYVCTMKYADSVKGDIAFTLGSLDNLLGEIVANNNLTQLRIAETEKYAHVTFFFDGTKNYDGVERPELKNCRRCLINSPKVATYDLKPEMSAYEVKDKLLEELKKDDLDLVICNFANCDMVGHTAVMSAVIKAVEAVDDCVGQVINYVDSIGGTVLVLADHGNAEECIDENNQPMTKHTTNLVPFCTNNLNLKFRDGGALCDVAPTILELLNIEQPEEMTGKSLLINK